MADVDLIDPTVLTTRIRRLVENPATPALVARYFDPESEHAGGTFLDLERSGPNEITPTDLVAASLLDVRFSPPAVRQLLSAARPLAPFLDGIPSDTALWEADSEDLKAVFRAFEALKELRGVSRVKASKLLARKRPSLVPVFDQVVDRVLALPLNRFRPPVIALATALADDGLRTAIGAVAPADRADVPLLRILDAAIWMSGSQSRAAKRARDELGWRDL